MVSAVVEITSVDYEASVAKLLPRVADKLRYSERLTFWKQLLEQLGEKTAVQVATRMIGMLDQREQTLLLCELSALYQTVLVEKVNQTLQTMDWGRAIRLQHLRALQREEGLVLLLEGIEIDYPLLASCETVRNKLGGGVARLMGTTRWNWLLYQGISSLASLSPDQIEQAAMALLGQELVQAKLREVLESNLRQAGLLVQLARMELAVSAEQPEPQTPAGLSEQAQQALVTALARWLRQSVEGEK